jgi:hypothetical protein
LGSGLNAGNEGAEIDVIKPALLAQTHAPIRYSLVFGFRALCSFIVLLILLQAIFCLFHIVL